MWKWTGTVCGVTGLQCAQPPSPERMTGRVGVLSAADSGMALNCVGRRVEARRDVARLL